jgi:hypothetical protein
MIALLGQQPEAATRAVMDAAEPPRRCPWRTDQFCPYRPAGIDAEIVRLVALGHTDYRIGREVGLSAASISHRIQRMARVLGIESGENGAASLRIRLAVYVAECGLTAAPTDVA